MFNIFKYTYRITEHTDSEGVWYEVEYGNFFNREFLDAQGKLWMSDYRLDELGGCFLSIDAAKQAIKSHLVALLEERLNQPTSKVIQYV